MLTFSDASSETKYAFLKAVITSSISSSSTLVLSYIERKEESSGLDEDEILTIYSEWCEQQREQCHQQQRVGDSHSCKDVEYSVKDSTRYAMNDEKEELRRDYGRFTRNEWRRWVKMVGERNVEWCCDVRKVTVRKSLLLLLSFPVFGHALNIGMSKNRLVHHVFLYVITCHSSRKTLVFAVIIIICFYGHISQVDIGKRERSQT